MLATDKLLKYWDRDRSLTAMLVLLALNILILAPASNLGQIVDPVAHASLGLLFVAGILTMGRGVFRIVALVVVSVAVACRLGVILFYGGLALHIAALASASVAYALIIYVVALMVYAEGPVTGHRIQGAVVLYLLIAALFAVLYECLELVAPGAFHFPTGRALTAVELRNSLTYFSCVTLTTVGYGDLTAVHPFARSLVIFEALVGQLYPAILLARLVTQYEGSMRLGKRGGGGKTPSQG
jgi:hypothetical protein